MEAIQSISSSCYELVSWAVAGAEVVAGTVARVWDATFGMVLDRMVVGAARRWEWLDGYYKEHPAAVMVAVVLFIAGGLIAAVWCLKCFCTDEEEKMPSGPYLQAVATRAK